VAPEQPARLLEDAVAGAKRVFGGVAHAFITC
jgi:hypothetical protein